MTYNVNEINIFIVLSMIHQLFNMCTHKKYIGKWEKDFKKSVFVIIDNN